MLDLAALVFKVDTSELDGAIQKVDSLTKAIKETTAPLEKLAQASTKASKAQEKAAEASEAQAVAQEKATQKAEKAAKAIKAKEEAQKKSNEEDEKSTEVISRSSAMLEKQTLSMRILRGETIDLADGAVQLGNSFTKGQAGMLATMKMAGGTADTMKALAGSFEEYNRITGLNTFDKSASGISKMQKELKELDAVLELSKTGMALTRDEIVNLVRDTERLTQQFKSEGKSADDLKVALAELNTAYVRDSASLNKRRAEAEVMEQTAKRAAEAEIKSAKDMVSANEYITKEMNRVAAAVDNAKEAIGTTASNQLVKMESALRKSGLSAEDAAAKLDLYKKNLLEIQKANEKSKGEYISRAVAPQITDIVVGLSTGQSPFTVLLQQGGQLRDQMGQVGIAADDMGKVLRKSMTDMLPSILGVGKGIADAFVGGFKDAGLATARFLSDITGVSIGVEALKRHFASLGEEGFGAIGKINTLGNVIGSVLGGAIAIGIATIIGLGVALKQTITENDTLARSLALSGGSLGLTAAKATEMANSFDKSIGTTANFTAALVQMAKAGGIASEDAKMVAESAVDMNKYLGVSIEEVVKQYSKLNDKPREALIAIAKETGLVSPEVLTLVANLEKQGKTMEAGAVAMQAYADVTKTQVASMKEDLSGLSLLAIDLGKNISGFFSELFKGVFYKASSTDVLANKLKGLQDQLEKETGWKTLRTDPEVVKSLEKQIEAVKFLQSLEKEKEESKSRQQKQNAKNAEVEDYYSKLAQKDLSTRAKLQSELTKVENQAREYEKEGLMTDERRKITTAAILNLKEKIAKEDMKGVKTASSSLDLNPTNEASIYEKSFNRELSAQRKAESERQAIIKDSFEAGKITRTKYVLEDLELVRSASNEQNALIEKAQKEREDIYIRDVNAVTSAYAKKLEANKGTKDEQEANNKVLLEARKQIENLTNSYADFNDKLGDERAKTRNTLTKKEADALKELLKPLRDVVDAYAEFQRITELRNTEKANQTAMEDAVRWATPEAAARIRAMAEETKFYDEQLSKTRANIKKLEQSLADMDAAGVDKNSKEYKEIYEGIATARDILNKEVADKDVAVQKAGADAVIKYYKDEWKRASDAVTDGIVTSLFEGGKAGSKKIRDYLVSELKKQITVPIQAMVNVALGAITGGITNALGGVASAGMSGLLSAGVSYLASSFLAPTLGLTSAATAASNAAIAFAATGDAAAAAAASSAAAAAGMSTFASQMMAAAPWAAGAIVAIKLLSSLDNSGTYHTGGASRYSADAGLTTGWREAQVSGFGGIDTSKATTEVTSGIAKTLVTILDSTAKAFGKAAGYEIATGFADDSSSDGAWGGLTIKKLGMTLVDWNKERQSKWAPKEFADGEAGLKQYQAALAKDTLAVLKDIGLPEWATKMLNDLGDAPTLEQLSSAVQIIQKTQVGLASLADVFSQIATLSDASTLSLLNLTGGIDGLVTSMSSYMNNYYSDSEKYTAQLNAVQKQFKSAGIEMPKIALDANGLVTNSEEARKEFRKLMEAQDLNTEAGRKNYVALLGVQQAFFDVSKAADDSSNTLANIASERKTLQDEYDSLTMSSTDLLKKQRDALDESNRALFDQIQAVKKAQAIAEERKGLQDQLDELTLSSTDLLNKQRNALDASNRALFDQIQAAKKSAAIAEEKKSLQDELDSLTMSSTDLIKKQRNALDDSNKAIFDQIQAAKKAANIASERKTLQDEYDNLTMSSTDLLKKQRDALDDSNKALFDAIQAAKKAAKIAEERTSLQSRLDELLGNTAALREAELAKLDESNRALQKRIWAIEDEKAAIAALLTAAENGYSALQRSVEAQKTIIQSRIDEITDTTSKLQSVFDMLGTSINDLYQTVSSTTEMQAAEAHQIILKALSTGVVPESSVITSAVNSVKNKVTGASYATQYEADKARLELAAELQQLQNVTGVQLTTAEEQLAEAKKQLAALDDILKQAEKQLNALKGIDDSVMTVADAIEKFQKLVSDYITATKTPTSASGSSGTSSGSTSGGSNSSGGFSVGGGGNSDAIVYSEEEKRLMSISKFFLDTYDGSVASIRKIYDTAIQYGVSQADINKATSMTEADSIGFFARAGIGKFAMGGSHPGGLRIVGENGPELEATGSARIWNATQTSDMLGNSDLSKQVKELKDEVVLMRSETIAIALNTGKAARILERARGVNDGIRTEAVV